jgi:hypothetical protein
MMSETDDVRSWEKLLDDAVVKLEHTPAAPPWLMECLRAARRNAPGLAPSEPAEFDPPPFFYPH